MTIEQFPDRVVAVTATINQSGNTTPIDLTVQKDNDADATEKECADNG